MRVKAVLIFMGLILTSLLILITINFGCDYGGLAEIPEAPTPEDPTEIDNPYSGPQYILERVDATHHHLKFNNPYPNTLNSVSVEGKEIHPLLKLISFSGTVRENAQGGYICDFTDASLTIESFALTFFAHVTVDENNQLTGKAGISAEIAGFDLLIEVPIDESQSDYPGWLIVGDSESGNNIVETHLYINDDNTNLDLGSSGTTLDLTLSAYDPKWEDPVNIQLLGKVYITCFISSCILPEGESAIDMSLSAFGSFGFTLGGILDAVMGLLGSGEEGGESGGGGIDDMLGDFDIAALLDGLNIDNIEAALYFLDQMELDIVGDLSAMDISLSGFQLGVTLDIPEGEPIVKTDSPLVLDLDAEEEGNDIEVYYLEALMPGGAGIFFGNPLNINASLDLENGGFEFSGLDEISIYISDSSLESQISLGLSLIANIMGIGIPTNFDGTFDPGTANLSPECEDETDPCYGVCNPEPGDTCYDPNRDDANLIPFTASGLAIAGLVEDPEKIDGWKVDSSGTVLPYIGGEYVVEGESQLLDLTISLGISLPLSTGEETQNIDIPLRMELPLDLTDILGGLSLD